MFSRELQIPKSFRSLALHVVACAIVAVASATSVAAVPQDASSTQAGMAEAAPTEVTQSQVDAIKERAQKAQLEEIKKQKVDASLAVAESNIARTLAACEKAKSNTELAANAEARVAELKKATADSIAENSSVAAIPQDEKSEALRAAKTELASAQAKLKEFQNLNAQRTEQAAQFTATLAKLVQQKVEIEEQLKAAAADENPILLEAKKLELQSGLQWIQKRVEELEVQLTDQRKQDTERAVADAKTQVDKALPVLKPFAEENAEIAKLATDILKPALDAKNELTKEAARLTKIQQQFTATINRVDAVGETASVGAYLRNRKTEIPREGWLSPFAAQRSADIEHYQSIQFDLKEKLQTLIPDNIVEETLAQAKALESAGGDAKSWKKNEPSIKAATLALVDRRKELLGQAIENHKDYLDSLTKLKKTENALAETTSKFHEYINERILWIRSNDVLFTKMSADKSDATVFSHAGWIDSATALGKSWLQNPLQTSLAALIFFSLFLYRFKLRRGIKENATQAARGTNTNFLPTLKTLLMTAAVAAPIPLALSFIGWRLGLNLPATALSIAISKALMHAGWFFFAAEFLRQVCRQDGLAEKHFDWAAGKVSKLKTELNWFVPIGAMFSFVCSIVYFADINHLSLIHI